MSREGACPMAPSYRVAPDTTLTVLNDRRGRKTRTSVSTDAWHNTRSAPSSQCRGSRFAAASRGRCHLLQTVTRQLSIPTVTVAPVGASLTPSQVMNPNRIGAPAAEKSGRQASPSEHWSG